MLVKEADGPTDRIVQQQSGGRSGLVSGLIEEFEASRRRWILWTPALLALGISLYFALDHEPAFLTGFVPVLVPALILAGLPRSRRDQLRLPLLAVILVSTGFLAAELRTRSRVGPVLPALSGPVLLTGTVVAIDRLDKGVRVLLRQPDIGGVEPAATPNLVRVRLRADDAVPEPGDRIRLRAILNPPPGPVEPGAYDFRRHAFFLGIAGTGFALTSATLVERTTGDEFGIRVERVRKIIAERVDARLQGAEAAVSTALLNGEATAIPEADLQALRLSGLQHLLSISGLHIGLVAGLVFFSVRALLALHETLALYQPIKKYAAAVALLAAIAYTVLVGAPVPTLRSVLMTGLVLLAVLLDRSPFSLRVIAFAAVVILLIQPESLLGPSFQMSFAAVFALIAVYESLRPGLTKWQAKQGLLMAGVRYVAVLALTSLVAGLATMPFALYHFQQVANYGVLANLIAVPITGVLVMPAGLIAYLLMLFGLEGWAIEAMGLGVRGILWTAHWVAGLPGSALLVPAVPASSPALLAFAGLWLVLWTGRLRLFAALPLALGLALAVMAERPDVLIAGNGRVIGLRIDSGDLLLSTRRSGRFEAEEWLQRDGGGALPKAWPKRGTDDGQISCQSENCLYRREEVRIGIIGGPDGAAELCRNVDIAIIRRPVPDCPASVVIDAPALTRFGAHSIFLRDGRATIRTASAGTGTRPWN
jgi:competence protein ComEC